MIKKMKLTMFIVSVVVILVETSAYANQKQITSLNNKPAPHLAVQPPSKASFQQVLPPTYLRVKNFNQCLGLKKEGTAKFYCLPAKRRLECPKESWEKLLNDTSLSRHTC